MIKSIQLFGTLALILAFTSGAKSQTLQEQMFDKFGGLTEWMNTPLINSHIESSKELEMKFHGLLGETAISDSKIIPLGKVEKGKNVTVLYLVVEYVTNGTLDFFNLHSTTLNKKNRYFNVGDSEVGEGEELYYTYSSSGIE